MRLPPKHQRLRRFMYRVARLLFPAPMEHCTALTNIERKAALQIRLGRDRATEGREHEEALGYYKAAEVIREHNRKMNFDRNAAMRARTPIEKPRLPKEAKK